MIFLETKLDDHGARNSRSQTRIRKARLEESGPGDVDLKYYFFVATDLKGCGWAMKAEGTG